MVNVLARLGLVVLLISLVLLVEGAKKDGAKKYGKVKQGKLKMRFDSFYHICPQAKRANATSTFRNSCPRSMKNSTKCSCVFDHERLNDKPNHFIATVEPIFLNQTRDAGNDPALQVDKINKGFPGSGAKFADTIYANAQKFGVNGGKVPKYVILNHVNLTHWKKNTPGYHKYIIDMATALKNKKMEPIVMVPIMFPTKKDKETLSALSKVAYIGVEAYLNSKKIMELPRPRQRPYMVAKYNKSLDKYAKYGVPRTRIVLWEHYGMTAYKKTYGRSGLNNFNWRRIIKMRSKAIKVLKVWGFGSFGWSHNGMKASNRRRGLYYKAYNKAGYLLP